MYIQFKLMLFIFQRHNFLSITVQKHENVIRKISHNNLYLFSCLQLDKIKTYQYCKNPNRMEILTKTKVQHLSGTELNRDTPYFTDTSILCGLFKTQSHQTYIECAISHTVKMEKISNILWWWLAMYNMFMVGHNPELWVLLCHHWDS